MLFPAVNDFSAVLNSIGIEDVKWRLTNKSLWFVLRVVWPVNSPWWKSSFKSNKKMFLTLNSCSKIIWKQICLNLPDFDNIYSKWLPGCIYTQEGSFYRVISHQYNITYIPVRVLNKNAPEYVRAFCTSPPNGAGTCEITDQSAILWNHKISTKIQHLQILQEWHCKFKNNLWTFSRRSKVY